MSLLILADHYALAIIPLVFIVASAIFSYFDHLGVINAKMNRESEQYRIFTGCEKVVDGKSKMAVIEVSKKTDNGVLGTEVYLCDSAEEALAKLATLCFMVDWYGYISQLYQPESVKDKITMEDLNDLCRVCEPSI